MLISVYDFEMICVNGNIYKHVKLSYLQIFGHPSPEYKAVDNLNITLYTESGIKCMITSTNFLKRIVVQLQSMG